MKEAEFPVTSILDILRSEKLATHLEKPKEELEKLYGNYVPKSVADNISSSELKKLIKNSFFEQSMRNLDAQLNRNSGAGYLLAQSFKLNYKGEGIEGFLEGIREQAKKEKEEEEEVNKEGEDEKL